VSNISRLKEGEDYMRQEVKTMVKTTTSAQTENSVQAKTEGR